MMNGEYSLKEVCEVANITRRQLQNYEKHRLLEGERKTNKYGHLIYRDDDVYRITYVRFLQDIGMSLNEIKCYFDEKSIKGKRFVLNGIIDKFDDSIKKNQKLLDRAGLVYTILDLDNVEKEVYQIITGKADYVFEEDI